jgi:hypothetical protein
MLAVAAEGAIASTRGSDSLPAKPFWLTFARETTLCVCGRYISKCEFIAYRAEPHTLLCVHCMRLSGVEVRRSRRLNLAADLLELLTVEPPGLSYNEIGYKLGSDGAWTWPLRCLREMELVSRIGRGVAGNPYRFYRSLDSYQPA